MVGSGSTTSRLAHHAHGRARARSRPPPASLTTAGLPGFTSTSARQPRPAATPARDARDALRHRAAQRPRRSVRMRAGQRHLVGDHVEGLAAVDRADRHDRRLRAARPRATTIVCSARDHVRRRHDRVGRALRLAAVAAAAVHHDLAGGPPRPSAGPAFTPSVPTGSSFQRWMPSTTSTPSRTPSRDHGLRAALALLGRLEQHAHAAVRACARPAGAPPTAPIATWPSWPQACIAPGTARRRRARSPPGSAGRPCPRAAARARPGPAGVVGDDARCRRGRCAARGRCPRGSARRARRCASRRRPAPGAGGSRGAAPTSVVAQRERRRRRGWASAAILSGASPRAVAGASGSRRRGRGCRPRRPGPSRPARRRASASARPGSARACAPRASQAARPARDLAGVAARADAADASARRGVGEREQRAAPAPARPCRASRRTAARTAAAPAQVARRGRAPRRGCARRPGAGGGRPGIHCRRPGQRARVTAAGDARAGRRPRPPRAPPRAGAAPRRRFAALMRARQRADAA